ncbi:MAG: leucyl/phenylalanyl-tRNA--protein transferase [Chloroflexota bacterium]
MDSLNKLNPQLLLNAYCQGFFPMSHEGEIYWYDPNPRAILPLTKFHISKSLRRSLKRTKVRTHDGAMRYFTDLEKPRLSEKPGYEIRLDTDFLGVMLACADPSRKGGWIDDQIIDVYSQMHDLGWAHSVETWRDGKLVGGLYGVAIGGLFAGESMFSLETDASKVALAWLVHHMRERGFVLLDVQFETSHLKSLGVTTITADYYRHLLALALNIEPINPFKV